MSTPSVGSVARALLTASAAQLPATGRALLGDVRALVGARISPLGPPVSAPGVEVEVITDEDASVRLAPAWEAIHRAAGARSGFATWPWLRAWWAEIEHPPGASLRLYVARAGGAVVGIAPTYLDGRVLRMLGETRVGSEHLDLLVADAHRAAVAAAIAGAIANDDALDAVELVDLVEGSALAEGLAAAGLIGAVDEAWQVLPYLPLPGSAAAWEASMSSNMRYNVRRKLKRLSQRYPAARLVVVDQEDALPAALDRLFELHARRWETKGQAGNFVRDDVRAFHRRVAPALLEREVLRLYQLEVEPGRIAATLYCLRSGGREQYLQAGFDPAFEDVSAGFCLMARVIAAAADAGVTEFDFLRGTESYKTHWATAQRTTRRFAAARPTTRGLLWRARQRVDADGRALVKGAVPPEWWAAARTWAERARGR